MLDMRLVIANSAMLKAANLLKVYGAVNCFVNQNYNFTSNCQEDSSSHTMLDDQSCTEVLQGARAAKVACYKIVQ